MAQPGSVLFLPLCGAVDTASGVGGAGKSRFLGSSAACLCSYSSDTSPMPLTPPSVQFSIRKLGLIKGHKFLMWDWETASEKKCVEAVIDWSSITRLEAAEEAQRSYGGTYEQCCAALKTRLENPRNLEKWNPELAALAQQLDKVQRTIDQLRAKQRDLNQKKAEVEALMRKQEV